MLQNLHFHRRLHPLLDYLDIILNEKSFMVSVSVNQQREFQEVLDLDAHDAFLPRICELHEGIIELFLVAYLRLEVALQPLREVAMEII